MLKLSSVATCLMIRQQTETTLEENKNKFHCWWNFVPWHFVRGILSGGILFSGILSWTHTMVAVVYLYKTTGKYIVTRGCPAYELAATR